MKGGALVRYLARLGYGTRREVTQLVAAGRVTDAAGRILTADEVVEHADLRVDGEKLDPPAGAVVMLHKPVGYACSTRDVNPVVYELLPPRFTSRSPVVAPVGRLDVDTSGLLLLTDEGQLNHLITSPRSHLPRIYEATLATDLRGDEAMLFASGTLMLKGEDTPVRAAGLEVLGQRHVRITLHEGRYHQVRRMFAAVGNHVETLHRRGLGPLALGSLGAGQWRVLTHEEVGSVRSAIASLRSAARRET